MAREIGAVSVRGNHDFEVIRRYIEERKFVDKFQQQSSTSSSWSQTQKDKYFNMNNNDHGSSSSNSNSNSINDVLGMDAAMLQAQSMSNNYNLKNGKTPDHLRIARELDEKDIEWLSSLPYFIHSPDLASLFVHAGEAVYLSICLSVCLLYYYKNQYLTCLFVYVMLRYKSQYYM